MNALQPDELRTVAGYIFSISGIALDDSKAYLIEGRLGGLAAELGCRSFGELPSRAQADGSGGVRRKILDAITTGETLFFRDTSPFDLLRHKVIPDLIDRRTRAFARTPIRIWSAACSTGQEIYSIAITLDQLLRGDSRFEIRLLGTDISDRAVARASKGHYNAIEMGRGLPDALRDRYFARSGDGWQVRDEVRAMATFKQLNLMEDFSRLGRFDIIFCRNVAIYFAEKERVSLFGRLERALERDGYLIIGSMESLAGVCPALESKRHLRAAYYQPKGAV